MLGAWIEWILLFTGLATTCGLVVFLAPVASLKLIYGQSPSDALSLILVRHWGLLIFSVGALMIYAAYHADLRVPTMIVAIVEKVAFALGMFFSPFHRRPTARVVTLADAGMATLYLMYLFGL